MPIEPLKEYALNYQFIEDPEKVNYELPELPPHVERVVKYRVIDEEYKQYVSLILARQYRSHITTAGQSYQIRKSHPLWVSFEKFSEIEFQPEYELSYVIYYNWLKPNRSHLNPLLRLEYEAIQKELVKVGNPL
jgi:hypothetical protein